MQSRMYTHNFRFGGGCPPLPPWILNFFPRGKNMIGGIRGVLSDFNFVWGEDLREYKGKVPLLFIQSLRIFFFEWGYSPPPPLSCSRLCNEYNIWLWIDHWKISLPIFLQWPGKVPPKKNYLAVKIIDSFRYNSKRK